MRNIISYSLLFILLNGQLAEINYIKEKYDNLTDLAAMIAYAKQFDQIGAPD